MLDCFLFISCLSISCSDGVLSLFFFQAEDGIRDLVRSRGLGDVYKRQDQDLHAGSGQRACAC